MEKEGKIGSISLSFTHQLLRKELQVEEEEEEERVTLANKGIKYLVPQRAMIGVQVG